MSTLYQTYIAPILATNAAKYILPVGTMWALSNGIHQYIFKKAWEGNWWPDRRVQKGKSPQKEPTAQIQAIPRTVGALTLYGAAAMCWFAFHRFWMDVDSRPESLLDMGKKLFMTAAYCDLIYYSYHRIQHEVSPTLYKLFHKQHHQFFVVTPEASEWDDPKEVVVLLLTIDWLPSYLAKLDFGTYFVWRLINEIRHEHFHSGYDLWWYPPNWIPGMFTAPMHDFHHAKNSGCYALWFRAMDWIFGTDKAFLAHKKRIEAGEADEVVPDEVK